ncbi:MAG: tRNA glutamyl-Q(34) synthetase GluQRS, partial [Planctomycetia bacterium]|nr:tRNA glutamyl-Q(34) synthetase GluQRS [Planctomycetia bacterium]
MRVVGRLAPSPTGAQHVGNARTYLLAWLSARSQGGSVRLRIEDIDSPRVKSGADLQAIEDLKWLGLDWDDEITVQSARPAPYLEALQHLRQRETVYACTCTRSDVERAASAPHLEHEGPVYPGTCSKRSARDIPDTPHCWRFRIPPETPSFEDAYQGHCRINLQQVGGDFVVWKSAQNPAYQLAVVVDDAASGVTEV